MPRIPLGEIEQALADPHKYRLLLDHPGPRFFPPSYFAALRDAVFAFHKPGATFPDATSHLEERLDGFKDHRRSQEMVEQFAWYVDDFAKSGLVNFETRLNIRLSLPPWTPPDLICSGQVARVDIVPSGGYAAWVFRAKEPGGWSDLLQMPLIQRALASSVLGAPSGEFSVGVISFRERFVESCTYSEEQIHRAQQTLEALLHEMGY
jgi:hypothetical protein